MSWTLNLELRKSIWLDLISGLKDKDKFDLKFNKLEYLIYFYLKLSL